MYMKNGQIAQIREAAEEIKGLATMGDLWSNTGR